ncbi:MAG: hypothetical protein RLZZ440_42, partial [Planctomycetota bacterium]
MLLRSPAACSESFDQNSLPAASGMHHNNTLLLRALALGASLFVTGPVTAAVVTSVGTNASGESWNTAADWSDNSAPAAGNDYVITNSFTIRSPASGLDTFAGDSLTVLADGTLALKNAQAVTVNDLIFDGGTLTNFTPSGNVTAVLDGGLTINAGGMIY